MRTLPLLLLLSLPSAAAGPQFAALEAAAASGSPGAVFDGAPARAAAVPEAVQARAAGRPKAPAAAAVPAPERTGRMERLRLSSERRERRMRKVDTAMSLVGTAAGVGLGIVGWGLAIGAGPWAAAGAAFLGIYVGVVSVWAAYGMATDRDFMKSGA